MNKPEKWIAYANIDATIIFEMAGVGASNQEEAEQMILQEIQNVVKLQTGSKGTDIILKDDIEIYWKDIHYKFKPYQLFRGSAQIVYHVHYGNRKPITKFVGE